MRERPILFSAPMVRAILDGRKTQTRRVVKPAIPHRANLLRIDDGAAYFCDGDHPKHHACEEHEYAVRCPYGQPGDRLWVRETWGLAGDMPHDPGYVEYRADCKDGRHNEVGDAVQRWRPSIHMPRWASRISLEVTGVRVERLQEISDEDAIAEGVDPSPGMRGDDDIMVHQVLQTFPTLRLAPVARYVLLWDSINGGKPGVANWNANPWVWVVEFRRVTQ